MAQRAQKQLKALQNKLANITADITILENELNLPELIQEKEHLEHEHSAHMVIVNEERNITEKIDEYIRKIKEYDSAKLTAEFEKKQALHTEQEIYANEQARIEFAYGEWKTYMHGKLDELNATRIEIEGILEDWKAEKVDVDTTIHNYNAIKRDLRMQNMNMILAQQTAYKQNKEQYKTHTDTMAGLLLEKAKYSHKINNYTHERYNINNDYYMWKCECEKAKKECVGVDTGVGADTGVDKNDYASVLFEKRAKLSRDSRQDYELRYMKLDNDLLHNQHMLKRIDKQLTKLDAEKKIRPVIQLNKNPDSYMLLEDYRIAKQSCYTVQQQIETYTCMFESIQREIANVSSNINSGRRPTEIVEFEERAMQRIKIMETRIEQKYTNTIMELDNKIQECRNLMAIYQKKYDISIGIRAKKEKENNIQSITNALTTVESKLERKLILDKLLQDKAQILESIAQLSVI